MLKFAVAVLTVAVTVMLGACATTPQERQAEPTLVADVALVRRPGRRGRAGGGAADAGVAGLAADPPRRRAPRRGAAAVRRDGDAARAPACGRLHARQGAVRDRLDRVRDRAAARLDLARRPGRAQRGARWRAQPALGRSRVPDRPGCGVRADRRRARAAVLDLPDLRDRAALRAAFPLVTVAADH